MNINDTVLTIDNNEYIVIETVELEDKIYVYLVNNSNIADSMFREVVFENEAKLLSIEKEMFSEKIYPMFLEKFKKY